MSDTPVVTAPVASAPSAPAPAAPSAPVSTPTPEVSPAATPATPEAAPVTTDTPAAPEAPAAPPAAASAPPEPKQADFQDAADFLVAHAQWERDNPKPEEEAPAPETPSAETPAEDKPADAPETTDDQLDPLAEDEVADLTPQALSELLSGNEALKTALDADPAAKGKIFSMARELAELKPLKGIFANADAAKFAHSTAQRSVELRTQFQQADTPEKMGKAFAGFQSEFAIVDAEGKPVVDAAGNPQYADDFHGLVDHVVGSYFDGGISEIEERLAANKYPNEAAKIRDEDDLLALQHLKSRASGEEENPAGVDLASLPEEARESFRRQQEELDRQREELGLKKKTETQEQRVKARNEYNANFGNAAAEHAGNLIDAEIARLRKAGAHVPDYALNITAPGSEQSVFGKSIVDQLLAIPKSDPYLYNQAIQFELMKPTPENLKNRTEFFNRIAAENIPRLVRAEVRKMGAKVKEEQAAKPAPKTTAQPEIQGGAPGPKGNSIEDKMAAAKVRAAKEVPNWENMDAGERNPYILQIARHS